MQWRGSWRRKAGGGVMSSIPTIEERLQMRRLNFSTAVYPGDGLPGEVYLSVSHNKTQRQMIRLLPDEARLVVATLGAYLNGLETAQTGGGE